MNVDRQGTPFCHPMTHPVRNRIPCHHVHTLLGTFQSPSSHQSPDPLHKKKFIHPWPHRHPSRFHPVLSTCCTLFKKKEKEKGGHRYYFRCGMWGPWSRYHPSNSNLILLIDLLVTRSPRKRKEKRKTDIRMLWIWACWSYHACSRLLQNRVFCLPCGRWVLYACSPTMVINVSMDVMTTTNSSEVAKK